MEDGVKDWKGEKRSLGRKVAGQRVRRNQWAEPKEEAGWPKQAKAEGLEEGRERARRQHLPQHSEKKVAGELRDGGKVALLSGGPGQRGSEQGVCQGLVVGEQGELSTL